MKFWNLILNLTLFMKRKSQVKLIEHLIKTYSNEGETVLDNTMGSGTTGIGCINTNRKFIGIELVEKYFKLSKYRITTTQ